MTEALHQSAEKSNQMLSRYADFKQEYEVERSEIERHAAHLQSENALLSAQVRRRTRPPPPAAKSLPPAADAN